MTKTFRALTSAVAGMALVGVLATSPALAADTPAGAPAEADDVPVIVDGVERSPAELATLKGKKLFVVNAKAGRPMVAFTDKREFKTYVRKHLGIELGNKPKRAKRSDARAAWAGDYATFYQHYDGYGWGFNINSGYGEGDLSFVGCFLWWCSNYNDQISSVHTHGVPAILFTETGYRGGTYVVGANQHANIPWWFNDVASSAYVYWNP